MKNQAIKKNFYSVVVRNKLTGEVYLSVCSKYLKRGNLLRYFRKNSENFDLIVCDDWQNRYLTWKELEEKIKSDKKSEAKCSALLIEAGVLGVPAETQAGALLFAGSR